MPMALRLINRLFLFVVHVCEFALILFIKALSTGKHQIRLVDKVTSTIYCELYRLILLLFIQIHLVFSNVNVS